MYALQVSNKETESKFFICLYLVSYFVCISTEPLIHAQKLLIFVFLKESFLFLDRSFYQIGCLWSDNFLVGIVNV